jgi:hypothetical protein
MFEGESKKKQKQQKNTISTCKYRPFSQQMCSKLARLHCTQNNMLTK